MSKIFVTLFLIALVSCQNEKFDVIIRQATVFDGSEQSASIADVGIRADTIAVIGDLSKAEASQLIEARGLALAPGFIDTHSHHDRGLNENKDGLAVVSQGVTTIVVGQDGGSSIPLKDYFKSLEDSAVAVNVGSYSGHNSIRDRVMGKDFKRKATSSEIDNMIVLLRDDLDAGALGLSTGLEYDPGIYSHQDEVLSLARVLPEYGSRYISHLRSEDRYFWEAINEIITIGRETKAPVQISHIKLAMRGLWGKADSLIQILETARREGVNVTADIYPYTYWSSTIRVLFPERNFKDENEAAFILKEVTSPKGIIFSNYEPNPDYNGKSLIEIAQVEKRTPEKMLIELIRRLDECDKQKGECDGSIVATSMDEGDVKKLMQWPHTNICSDGASSGRHPRGFGAFTRVLGYYVREQKTFPLELAINKMTLLSAQNLGIKKRGKIAPGFYADLVLFNAQNVKDNAIIQQPQQISTGIEKVWVNGKIVFADGKTTREFPGRVLRRE